MADQSTWQDVIEVVLNSWPAGPGNKGWEREQLAGYVGELNERRLTPAGAIFGLRASRSAFIPSAGEVLGLVKAAQGPPTAAQIEEAGERMRERREVARLIRMIDATPPNDG